ncbi:hypothetical protein FRB93_002198 [Tulasnella sp. JGI-2019a]|nr:hypothetical protein FRB93_002198 [Tulasnella sp. JGI-2019a]
MSPTRTMRVRISSERRSEDSSYTRDYSYLEPSPSTSYSAPRVLIDSHGTAHDPDFLSHILSDHRELTKRRAASNQKAKRLSQRGLIYNQDDSDSEVDSDDEDVSDSDMPRSSRRLSSRADPFRSSSATERSAQSYYVETPSMEARRLRIAAQAQPGNRRTSFATSTTFTSSSSGSSPNSQARYLLAPSNTSSTPMLEEDMEETPAAVSSASGWSLKRRWSKRLVDVPEHDGPATKPNTLKKKEPSQPPFVFHDDDEEEDDQHAIEADSEDETYTCGEALRRQWQSIVVRVTLSAHRAKRRLRSKRNSDFNEKLGT